MSPVRAVLFLAIAVSCTLAPSAHAGDWTVGEIKGPSGTTQIEPIAVNARGEVVGQARFSGKTIQTAFYWANGVMIELNHPAGMEFTRARDINDSGVIAGYAGSEQPCCTSQYSTQGAVWTVTNVGGAPTSSVQLMPYSNYGAGFTTTDYPARDRGSSALGINNAGVVAGRTAVERVMPISGDTVQVTLPATGVGGWGTLTLPSIPNGYYGGTAYGINDNGDVIGTGGPSGDRARVWPGGGGTGTVFEIFGGMNGFANGFTERGHIAGRTGILGGSGTGQQHQALLWNGTEFVSIGAGQSQSVANAVNEADWAVGRAGVFYSVLPRTAGNAWLWRPNEAPAPLYTLGPTGWSMSNATDINDDGMIVGSGKHGSTEMGFWMAPASIAHQLTGKVYGPTGDPVSAATVRVTNAAQQQIGSGITGADGAYTITLPRGGPYDITVLPEGSYLPNGLAGCTIVDSACRLNLGWNRTVDFYGTNIIVPPSPGDPSPPTGSGDPSGPPKDTKGPAFSVPGANKTLTASKGGAVGFKLPAFTEDVKGSVALQTAAKVRASAKAAVLSLGTKAFAAKKGKALTVKITLSKKGKALLKKQKKVKAIAVVTARDSTGNPTIKRFPLTIKR